MEKSKRKIKIESKLDDFGHPKEGDTQFAILLEWPDGVSERKMKLKVSRRIMGAKRKIRRKFAGLKMQAVRTVMLPPDKHHADPYARRGYAGANLYFNS